jgi:hypothetical protein
MVPTEALFVVECQWKIWKVSPCYGTHWLLWNLLVDMKVNGCYGRHRLLWKYQ